MAIDIKINCRCDDCNAQKVTNLCKSTLDILSKSEELGDKVFCISGTEYSSIVLVKDNENKYLLRFYAVDPGVIELSFDLCHSELIEDIRYMIDLIK